MTSRPTTRTGVAADHARLAAELPGALAATALRMRSLHAREVLAEAAWPGRSPAELDAWALEASHLPPAAVLPAIADYARVLAVQRDHAQDRAVARSLLEMGVAHAGWEYLDRAPVELLAQLRVLDGDAEGARMLARDPRVRPDVAASVVADSLHPVLCAGPDPTAWAEAFGDALHSARLAPFLPPPAGSLPSLDRLGVQPCAPVADPCRITVLMSTYRAGPELLTAVRSVLGQTWQDLELFVVDDASADEAAAAVLDEVAGLDSRVRVVRKAVNGGTYRARNTALRRATGDLVVVIDSDDWWHPQTLELCAEPLLADQSLLATRAEGVRVSPNLVLTRPGYRPRFPSAATVLFRRRDVLRRIGFFDPTRKGADTEFARRLEAAFGPVVEDIPETTTLLRSDAGSLSAGEFSHGWRHPARHQYKTLYGAWHEEIRLARSPAHLDPEGPRRLPEPGRWARPVHPLVAGRSSYDVCFAGDWRKFGGPQASMIEEIRAARGAGLRVAIMHLEALRFMSRADGPLAPPVVELVRDGMVDWVGVDDDVDIDVLLVRYPPILQYPPSVPDAVRPTTVVVVANQAPAEADGSDQRYVVRDVSERTEELFGTPPVWLPQSGTIRRLLLEQDPDVRLADWDNPGLIDSEGWAVREPRAPGAEGRPVVVGRLSRDDPIKFPPSYDELRKGYLFPRGYEVRMLGAVRTVGRLVAESADPAQEVPRSWTLLKHGSTDVRSFLGGLDFFLYLDNPHAHEAFGRVLLEAAASGVLTIAHPKHRATFGDLLDYALPGEAQALIARYVADPRAYAARVGQVQQAVADRYGHQGFVRHLQGLLTPDPQVEAADPSGQTLEPRGPQAPLDLSAADPARRATTVGGLPVARLDLRSAADGERADALVVVHDHSPEDQVRRWLRPFLATGGYLPGQSLTDLVDTAPAGVVAVLARRDGLVWAAGRGRWRLVRDGDLCRAAREGAELAGPWSDIAWWPSQPPGPLVLLGEATGR